jgi:hypothetical protein
MSYLIRRRLLLGSSLGLVGSSLGLVGSLDLVEFSGEDVGTLKCKKRRREMRF